MSDAVIVGLLSLLALPISIFITWFANRRRNVSDIFKNITESSNLSVDASQAAVELMQATMETLSHELEVASNRINELSKEIGMLRKQNVLLLEENHALHAKIDDLAKAYLGDTGPIPLPERPASGPVS